MYYDDNDSAAVTVAKLVAEGLASLLCVSVVAAVLGSAGYLILLLFASWWP